MGARLLPREQAYAVGLKARKAAIALKADVAVKKMAVHSARRPSSRPTTRSSVSSPRRPRPRRPSSGVRKSSS
jgi:hypothetical protein